MIEITEKSVIVECNIWGIKGKNTRYKMTIKMKFIC